MALEWLSMSLKMSSGLRLIEIDSERMPNTDNMSNTQSSSVSNPTWEPIQSAWNHKRVSTYVHQQVRLTIQHWQFFPFKSLSDCDDAFSAKVTEHTMQAAKTATWHTAAALIQTLKRFQWLVHHQFAPHCHAHGSIFIFLSWCFLQDRDLALAPFSTLILAGMILNHSSSEPCFPSEPPSDSSLTSSHSSLEISKIAFTVSDTSIDSSSFILGFAGSIGLSLGLGFGFALGGSAKVKPCWRTWVGSPPASPPACRGTSNASLFLQGAMQSWVTRKKLKGITE